MNFANSRQMSPLLLACALMPLAARAAASEPHLPDRLLTCSMRHIVNFDPSKEQTAAELRFDAVHDFLLRLPPIATRTGPPPEAFEAPEPVDPQTRIVADPDHIAPQPGQRFDRVVDYWPERVELASTIAGNLLNVIVVHPIDPAAGTANMFMTRASELTHFDGNFVFQGSCRVQIVATIATVVQSSPRGVNDRAIKP